LESLGACKWLGYNTLIPFKMFRFERRPSGSEGFWRTARAGADKLEALADGTDGAATLAGDLINGHALHAIETENGEEGGRFAPAFTFKAFEENEGGASGGQDGRGGRVD
jgi:hypothetical protein